MLFTHLGHRLEKASSTHFGNDKISIDLFFEFPVSLFKAFIIMHLYPGQVHHHLSLQNASITKIRKFWANSYKNSPKLCEIQGKCLNFHSILKQLCKNSRLCVNFSTNQLKFTLNLVQLAFNAVRSTPCVSTKSQRRSKSQKIP